MEELFMSSHKILLFLEVHCLKHTQKKSAKQISFTGAPAAKTAAKGAKHYEPGDLVEHKVFGRGQVVAVKPAAGDQIVEINFEKVGIKKTMANFAPLTKITAEE